jgi:hypothetical protein
VKLNHVVRSFCAFMLLSGGALAQKTPSQVGRLVAEDLLGRAQISFVSNQPLPGYPHLSVHVSENAVYSSVHYAEACTGFGVLPQVCEGTTKSQEIDYYLERPRITGGLHGQAPTLWFAAERIALLGQDKRERNPSRSQSGR